MSSTTITASLSHKFSVTSDGQVRLRLWISEATGISPKLFLLRVMPTNVAGDLVLERVCTYPDLWNYDDVATKQVYRAGSADLLFTAKVDADEVLVNIQAGLDELLASIPALQVALPEVQTVMISDTYYAEITSTTDSDTDIRCAVFKLINDVTHATVPVFLVGTEDSQLRAASYELYSVSSAEDMSAYAITPSVNTLFRTDSVTLYFNDAAQMEQVRADILSDLELAVVGLGGVPTATTVTIKSATCTSAPSMPV